MMKTFVKKYVDKRLDVALALMEERAKEILNSNDFYKDLYIDPDVDIVNIELFDWPLFHTYVTNGFDNIVGDAINTCGVVNEHTMVSPMISTWHGEVLGFHVEQGKKPPSWPEGIAGTQGTSAQSAKQ